MLHSRLFLLLEKFPRRGPFHSRGALCAPASPWDPLSQRHAGCSLWRLYGRWSVLCEKWLQPPWPAGTSVPLGGAHLDAAKPLGPPGLLGAQKPSPPALCIPSYRIHLVSPPPRTPTLTFTHVHSRFPWLATLSAPLENSLSAPQPAGHPAP